MEPRERRGVREQASAILPLEFSKKGLGGSVGLDLSQTWIVDTVMTLCTNDITCHLVGLRSFRSKHVWAAWLWFPIDSLSVEDADMPSFLG